MIDQHQRKPHHQNISYYEKACDAELVSKESNLCDNFPLKIVYKHFKADVKLGRDDMIIIQDTSVHHIPTSLLTLNDNNLLLSLSAN